MLIVATVQAGAVCSGISNLLSEKQVMVNRVTIWCLGSPPPSGGQVYSWNGYSEERSLLGYIEQNAERIRGKYLKFIKDVGEYRVNDKSIINNLQLDDGFSYWWMTLLVEKSYCKSPITDVLKLLAIEDILLSDEFDELTVVGGDTRLEKSLKGVCACKGIKVYLRDGVGDTNRKFSKVIDYFYLLPFPLQGFIAFCRYVIIRWSLKRASDPKWFSDSDSVLFFSYFDNLDQKKAKNGSFYSDYWKTLSSILVDKKINSNWLQLYVNTKDMRTPALAGRLIKKFNEATNENGCHGLLDAYLSWKVILKVLLRWVGLINKAVSLKDIQNGFLLKNTMISLWPYFEGEWKNSLYGPAAMNNLFAIELFSRAFKDIPTQVKGFYLCENQSWERALIHCWRKNGHGQLIGVAHSTIRFWDLRYFADRSIYNDNTKLSMPMPDAMALNGPVAIKCMQKGGYPYEKIVACEALRYIQDRNAIAKRNYAAGVVGKKRKILILGDLSREMTIDLLHLIEEYQKSSQNSDEFSIKPHPNCPMDVFEYPDFILSVRNEPLGQILDEYDVAFASNSTSAVVDAYISGLPVIIMLLDSEVNFSPLRGSQAVHFVSSVDQVDLSMGAIDLDKDRVPVDADIFFLDSEFPLWSRLLESC